MANGDDYTPDFMTPGQIAANRAYAKALMQAGLPGNAVSGSSGNVTAVSPLAPFVQGVSGLYGRSLMDQAGNQERESMVAPNRAITAGPIPGEPGQAGLSINPPGSPTNALAYSGDGGGQVKGSWFGNFKGQNNWVDSTDSGLQASGAPTSVPGIALPNRGTLGQLFDVTTPDGRTFTVRQTDLGPAKWTGRGVDINSALAEQMGYTPKSFPTDGKFTVKPHQGAAAEQTQSAMGGSQLPTLQFAGPGAAEAPDTENDAQAGIVTALQRPGVSPAGPGAPATGMPGRVPAGGGEGGQIVPSGFIQPRQQISRQQFMAIMSNPYADPGLKQYVANSYFSQFAPIGMQGPFGWQIVQDAQGHQIAIPPAPHWGEVGVGDVKIPRAQYPTLGGGMVTMGGGGGPVTQAPQGTGTNIPSGGPQAPAGPGLNIGGGAGDIAAGRGAPTPPVPGPRSEAEPAGKPVQVASLETGTATDAGPALAYAAPTAGPALATPPPRAGGVQTAQAGGKSFTDMSDEELANYSQERGLAREFGSEDIKAYSKKYEGYQDAGNKAITGLPQIQMARNMIEDPRMIQGPWADFKQSMNNAFTALTGNDRTTAATTLRDAFDKIRSGGILTQMRETLAGLGQVRLAEIQLLGQATASAGNSLGANRAILTLAERSAQQMSDIGQITGLYRQGYRWDNKGNLLTQNAGDRPTTAGQEQAIRTYLLSHPLLSPDEIKQYKEFLSLPQDKGKAKAAAAQPTAAEIQAEIARRAKAAQ